MFKVTFMTLMWFKLAVWESGGGEVTFNFIF